MKQFTLRPMVVAISLASLLMGGAANAALVIDTSATAVSGSNTEGPNLNSGSGYVSSSGYASDGYSSANAYTFGYSSGSYAVSNASYGYASVAESSVVFNHSITNTLSVAAAAKLSFYVYGGSINAFLNDTAGLVDGEELLASYAASVSVGGNDVWFSSASVFAAGSLTGGEKLGVELGLDSTDDGYYSWGGQWFEVDLGVVGAGQTIDVATSLAGMALSNVGTYTYSYGCGYNGYGYSGYGYDGYGSGSCESNKGGASVFYGDPGNLSFDPFEIVLVPTTPGGGNDVPLPGTLALLGIGGIASLLRRRRAMH